MFCHKCGAQLSNEELFCHKCGAKVIVSDDAEKESETNTAYNKSDADLTNNIELSSNEKADNLIEKNQVSSQQSDISERDSAHENQPKADKSIYNNDNSFLSFVDGYVKKKTNYQSAAELLNSKISNKHIWICFGIPAVLAFFLFLRSPSISSLIAVLFLILIIGYPAALLADFFDAVRVAKNLDKVCNKIDTDDLVNFLNTNLKGLTPYFNEWGYVVSQGYGVRGAITAEIINSVSDIRIGSLFGNRKSCFVEIYVKTVEENSSGYSFGTAMRSVWPSRYVCITKALPILEAAMEYYANNSSVDIESTGENNIQSAVTVQTSPIKVQGINSKTENTKKNKKSIIGIVIGIAAVIIIGVIISNWEDKTDYEGTVKAHQPFMSSGLSYSYGDVFNKYITDDKWSESESDNSHYVKITGTIKGTDRKIEVVIEVAEDSTDSDIAIITVKSVTIDDEKSPTTDDAKNFIANMFIMYDEQCDDISGLFDDTFEYTESSDESEAQGNEVKSYSADEAQNNIQHWLIDHPIGESGAAIDSSYTEVKNSQGSDCYKFALWVDAEEYTDIYFNKLSGEMTIDSINYDEATGRVNYIEMPIDKWYSEVYKASNENIATSFDSLVFPLAWEKAYADKVQDVLSEYSDATFSLVDLTSKGLPELVVEYPGCFGEVFTYDGDTIVYIMDFGYGAGGNMGYDYIPGSNTIRNFQNSNANASVNENYFKVTDSYEVVDYYEQQLWYCNFEDKNNNGIWDDNEEYCTTPNYYYGNTKLTDAEYASYQIYGDYRTLQGLYSADQILLCLSEKNEEINKNAGQISYNYIFAYDFLGMSVEDVMEDWGEPVEFTEGYGVNYAKYNGIQFNFDYQRIIRNVELTPEKCYIGQTKLDGTREEIIDILGIPSDEYWSSDYEYYNMYYDDAYNGMGLRFEFDSPYDKPYGVWIWK